MSQIVSCKGVVLREISHGESDKYIDVLTDEYGLISVLCKGIKSYKNKNRAIASLYYYADFQLYVKNETYILKEGEIIETFYGIRDDLESAALAAYVSEITRYVSNENQNDNELIRLVLNTLYSIANRKYDMRIIKGVFELRLCMICGMAPNLVGCDVCGIYEDELFALDMKEGVIFCSRHFDRQNKDIVILSKEVLKAMRWAIYSDPSKLFSFDISEEDKRAFSSIAQTYAINVFERSFGTLEFYNGIVEHE